ncbi:MAG: Cys-tRNA(Pro) deacylase [Clostridiales bacterium]|nr:Cys-tRNA(Pro) deacylase [Clostridiales bacterium]
MTAPEKTNVMRMLEAAGISYTAHGYDATDGKTDGVSVAEKIGRLPEMVFKTLLTVAASGEICVFVLPVAEELDLKKAARAAEVKNIEMAPVKDILKISGYVKGGCSPVGMKRLYRTFIDENAILLDTMVASAGKIGAQIELKPDDLLTLIQARYADLCKLE